MSSYLLQMVIQQITNFVLHLNNSSYLILVSDQLQTSLIYERWNYCGNRDASGIDG